MDNYGPAAATDTWPDDDMVPLHPNQEVLYSFVSLKDDISQPDDSILTPLSLQIQQEVGIHTMQKLVPH